MTIVSIEIGTGQMCVAVVVTVKATTALTNDPTVSHFKRKNHCHRHHDAVSSAADRGAIRTMITLLTCTGDRPKLFRRLECWMSRQSLQWTNWIVVDDGLRKTKCTLGQRYIRLVPGLSPVSSFARNLSVGLKEHSNLQNSEYVFFIEDDDWYGPHFVASLLIALMTHELVGESHHRYYNVTERSYHHCRNAHHAALCATAFRATLIPHILSLVDDNSAYLDLRIWARLHCSKHLQRTGHCVGLKAQAGRPGLTWGHQSDGFRPDPDGIVLKKWLGDDADIVLKHSLNRGNSSARKHHVAR